MNWKQCGDIVKKKNFKESFTIRKKEFVDFIRDKSNAKNLSEDSGIKL